MKKEAVVSAMKTFGEVCYGEAAVQVLQSNYALVHTVGLTLPCLESQIAHAVKNDVILLPVQA